MNLNTLLKWVGKAREKGKKFRVLKSGAIRAGGMCPINAARWAKVGVAGGCCDVEDDAKVLGVEDGFLLEDIVTAADRDEETLKSKERVRIRRRLLKVCGLNERVTK
jgi:hypothetical protein